MPKVSVCLPNLNNVEFLDERVESILGQTLTDWELVIFDNYSEDGAWELFQRYAKQDSRILIEQAPKNGMYPNWNNCIKKAKGDYIYIATSDDSMMPDCLEKMVIALEDHPECDICHCKLLITDKEGNPTSEKKWEDYDKVRFFGDGINQKHIRYAPHDGVLTFFFGTAYLSMTQVLIRRSAFEKVGLFRPDWGGIGDMEWQMRAGLLCNTIHIPEILATWRKYEGQGCSLVTDEASRKGWWHDMGVAALHKIKQVDPELYEHLNKHRLLSTYSMIPLWQEWGTLSGRGPKLKKLFSTLLCKPSMGIDMLRTLLKGILMHQGQDLFIEAKRELKQLKVPVIRFL